MVHAVVDGSEPAQSIVLPTFHTDPEAQRHLARIGCVPETPGAKVICAGAGSLEIHLPSEKGGGVCKIRFTISRTVGEEVIKVPVILTVDLDERPQIVVRGVFPKDYGFDSAELDFKFGGVSLCPQPRKLSTAS